MSDCSTCDEDDYTHDSWGSYHCRNDNCGHFDKNKNKWIKTINNNGDFCRKCDKYYCNACSQSNMTNFKKFILESECYAGEEFWTLNYKEQAKLCKNIGQYDEDNNDIYIICYTCMNEAILDAKKTKKRKISKKKKESKNKKIKK